MDSTDRNFIDWLAQSLTSLDSTSLCLIAAIVYQIWQSRNLIVFQNKQVPVLEALSKAINSAEDFFSQNSNSTTNTPSNNLSTQGCNTSWSPPSTGYLKLNVDAHYLGDGRWGLGWILRREDGGTVAVATKVVRSGEEVKNAEALGILEALQFISKQGLRLIVVESDSQECVKAITSKCIVRSY